MTHTDRHWGWVLPREVQKGDTWADHGKIESVRRANEDKFIITTSSGDYPVFKGRWIYVFHREL